MDLVCVHPDLLPRLWPMVKDMIFTAVKNADLGHTADVEKEVMHGNGVLWLAIEDDEIRGALATVLVKTDQRLVCMITALGGHRMKDWFHFLPQIEAWAKSEGATRMRLYGRRGWVRLLKDYYVSNVVMEKEL